MSNRLTSGAGCCSEADSVAPHRSGMAIAGHGLFEHEALIPAFEAPSMLMELSAVSQEGCQLATCLWPGVNIACSLRQLVKMLCRFRRKQCCLAWAERNAVSPESSGQVQGQLGKPEAKYGREVPIGPETCKCCLSSSGECCLN